LTLPKIFSFKSGLIASTITNSTLADRRAHKYKQDLMVEINKDRESHAKNLLNIMTMTKIMTVMMGMVGKF